MSPTIDGGDGPGDGTELEAARAEPGETGCETPGAPVSCRVLQVTSPFMQGPDVLAVQQALLAKGYNPGPLDGVYGPSTANAVEQFQASSGLLITGQVCGETYTLLGVACVSVPPCPVPGPIQCRVLKVQSPFLSGQDVFAVQHALVARGFNPGAVDGVYGPATAAAVRAFQSANGLAATGVVCGQTYELLKVGCSVVPPCPTGITCRVLTVTSPFLSGDDVRAVQQALIARGFNPGAVDGIYGPRTAAAVQAFQSASGLSPTGVVCGQTYVLLGVNCQTVPPCPPVPGVCRVLVTSNPFLSGPDVLAVQQALKAAGFDPGPLDGIYGPLTASAVRRLQAAHGLVATGVVCDDLYGVLGVSCATVPPCPVLPPITTCRRLAVTTPFLRGSDVAAVQTALANRGFDPGAVDGIYGPNTAAAVSGFQAAAGLPVTGVVCTAEYRALLLNCVSFPSCS